MTRRHDPDSVGARLGSRSVLKAARKTKADPARPKPAAGKGKRQIKKSAPSKMAKAPSPPPPRPPPKSSPKAVKVWRWPKLRAPKTGLKLKTPEPIAGRLEAFEAMPSPLRIHLVIGLFAVCATAILGRAAQLQLVEGEAYRSRAVGQGTTETRIDGRRGRILDRHGVELASSADAVSISARRGRVESPRIAARKLAPMLSVRSSWLERRLRGKGFVWLKRRVPPSVGEGIRALDIPGVEVHPARRRLYGNGRLAAHVLGFVDVDEVGRRGVERSMQGRLQRREVRVRTVADALRRSVWSTESSDGVLASGDDIHLTLDRQVQYVTEEALEAAVKEQKARAGVAIVMESSTSEILAMASYPSFNPNNVSSSHPGDRKNRVVEADYEPGSTAKIMTLAAAIEAGVATPGKIVDCELGQWTVDDRTIRDANHAFGKLTVAEVMSKSSNIGAGKLGLEVGATRLHEMLVRFGFGARTGVELPAELKGRIRDARKWRRVDTVNVSFGQGFTATPLQIVQAANVVANGGWLRPPSLVRTDDRTPSSEGRRVLQASVAHALRDMMIPVAAPGGTAPKAGIPGFSVAGKTGTAQKYDRARGGYSHEKHVASFVGFVPARRPKVTVLVLVDEPRKSIYGGEVAGPVFRRIAAAALASMDMYPAEALASTVREDPKRAAAPTRAPELDGAALDAAMADLGFETPESPGLSTRALALLGEPRTREGAGATSHPSEPTARIMPDLRGLALSSALRRCRRLGLQPIIEGAGRVAGHRPAPGARIGKARQCALELRRDG